MFYWSAGDKDFLLAQRHLLLMPFGRLNAPNMHLFLEHQAAFHFQNFLNDRDDRYLAFLAYGRHGIDWSVDRNVLDLHLLVIQQLIDHLLMVMSDSRYTDS
jgi:hypothetical protein